MKSAWLNFTKYRFLLGELVKKDIKLKYRRSYLGIFWTLLEPILTTVVLTFVFGKMRGVRDAQFPVYILTGRLLYSFYSNSTKSAMKSIRSNSAMIKKVYIPKYMYPFATVLSNYIIFLISLIVLFGALFVFNVMPTFYILQSIIPLFLILILAIGSGMILATLAVFFRDLEYLWSVALMIIMYTSAIFYRIKDLHLGDSIWVFKLNPLFVIIDTLRSSVFGTPINQTSLVLSIVYSLGSLLIGFLLFYKNQDKFILNI